MTWRLLSTLLILSLAIACNGTITLSDVISARAGDSAVDCGHTSVGDDLNRAKACVVEAFRASKPFKVSYDVSGIDSHVAVGIARASDGTVTIFWYDGDPAGGGGDAHPVITAQICVEPREHPPTAEGPAYALVLDCASVVDLGRISK